ncbi:MAG: hypothetical protein QW035_02245 [Candidatus Anstonellales archaeon]
MKSKTITEKGKETYKTKFKCLEPLAEEKPTKKWLLKKLAGAALAMFLSFSIACGTSATTSYSNRGGAKETKEHQEKISNNDWKKMIEIRLEAIDKYNRRNPRNEYLNLSRKKMEKIDKFIDEFLINNINKLSKEQLVESIVKKMEEIAGVKKTYNSPVTSVDGQRTKANATVVEKTNASPPPTKLPSEEAPKSNVQEKKPAPPNMEKASKSIEKIGIEKDLRERVIRGMKEKNLNPSDRDMLLMINKTRRAEIGEKRANELGQELHNCIVVGCPVEKIVDLMLAGANTDIGFQEINNQLEEFRKKLKRMLEQGDYVIFSYNIKEINEKYRGQLTESEELMLIELAKACIKDPKCPLEDAITFMTSGISKVFYPYEIDLLMKQRKIAAEEEKMREKQNK